MIYIDIGYKSPPQPKMTIDEKILKVRKATLIYILPL